MHARQVSQKFGGFLHDVDAEEKVPNRFNRSEMKMEVEIGRFSAGVDDENEFLHRFIMQMREDMRAVKRPGLLLKTARETSNMHSPSCLHSQSKKGATRSRNSRPKGVPVIQKISTMSVPFYITMPMMDCSIELG